MSEEEQRHRILVVDDTPENVKVIGTVLREEGHRIQVATNGRQALDLVQQGAPDLILLDVIMPDLDGFETCRQLKADARTAMIPVIFLTARAETDDVVRGFEAGAVDYVAKPFNPTELLVRVRTHLTLDTLKRDLERRNVELQQAMRRLEETQEELLLQEKMASLGNLAAGLAHEINSPIGAIRSSTDVAARCVDRLSDAEQDRDRVLKILRDGIPVTQGAVDRIDQLARSLRNFAALDGSEYNTADIHEGLDSCLTLLDNEIQGRLTVARDYADDGKLGCYPGLLNQAFLAILRNAVEAIDGPGTVSVRTRREDRRLTVSVIDTGRGIPADRLQGIFDIGFRDSGATVRMRSGLSTAQSIVLKHRGEIHIDSEVGEGTTVTISLPTDLSDATPQSGTGGR